MRPLRVIVASLALGLSLPDVAAAHEVRQVGPLEVVVGWEDEPAIAAVSNAVEVTLDGRGADRAELEAVVVFGEDGAATEPLPLQPSADDPHRLLAAIIPTRPGTYTFEISGEIAGRGFEESFTSGEGTFDDVRNPSEIEFPVQDPTRGELAEGLERLSGRVEGRPAATGRAESSDPLARWVAAGALVLALVSAIAAMRRRPTSG